ncbi:hypothetical protein COU79_02685 [Candidatus Peregrinibacteria bacterium CG10_big_fil_rev_8_21_14_0_10_54_7]|nr:MAG: hypothetical protein COU79_02685 [Candidatus Peregrinibacteria bacterium CG10_big_fil_rev_8_21_14_0_10_54_7]
MTATPAGGVLDMDCKANGLNGECLKQFVVMKHPYLNNIGLFFLVAGFFVEFIPAIPQILEWFSAKIHKSKS